MMVRRLIGSVCLIMMFACSAAEPRSLAAAEALVGNAQVSTAGLPRIVAIGDVHGDFEQFTRLLRATGLVDKRNRWTGGTAQLVQLGDIPDRGPDSRKVMDLLMKLEESADKAGGVVTVLIGNHEAMMMINDLRYVHPGEYKSFKDKNSRARRAAYYQQTIDHLTAVLPEDQMPKFDKTYKAAWEKRFPLGYVEHRIAWAPTGTYGKWVLTRPAVAVIGDNLFAHGGLSTQYAAMSIQEMNTRVRTDLADASKLNETSILEDEFGPLWHRGWVSAPQTAENEAALDAVLAAFKVKRMVVAHTPLLPIVLPRFGGKLLVVDVGLSEHYGHGFSALVIDQEQSHIIVGDQQIPLPISAEEVEVYLDAAKLLLEDPGRIDRYRAAEAAALEREAENVGGAQEEAPEKRAMGDLQ